MQSRNAKVPLVFTLLPSPVTYPLSRGGPRGDSHTLSPPHPFFPLLSSETCWPPPPLPHHANPDQPWLTSSLTLMPATTTLHFLYQDGQVLTVSSLPLTPAPPASAPGQIHISTLRRPRSTPRTTGLTAPHSGSLPRNLAHPHSKFMFVCSLVYLANF